MANYTPNAASIAGVAPTYNAAASSDVLQQNDGKVIIHVKNGGGSSINVTIDDQGSAQPPSATAFNPDVVVAVPNAADRFIGPFPVSRFTENVGLAFSATTSVTWAAIKIP